MQDQAKVQALWTALAPLVCPATQILENWRKYSRQADNLNELQQLTGAAVKLGAYPQEDANRTGRSFAGLTTCEANNKQRFSGGLL